jgi:hypothetical protein
LGIVQEVISCGETSVLTVLFDATHSLVENASVAAKAQHDPQLPWLMGLFSHLQLGHCVRASNDEGMVDSSSTVGSGVCLYCNLNSASC